MRSRVVAFAAGLVLLAAGGVALTQGADAAAVPVHHPTRLAHVGDARQLVVVTSRSNPSSYASLRTYQLGANGTWTERFAAMPARVGYAGWVPAASRVQDTGTTPQGTFRLTEAFGLRANPGTRLRYRPVDGNDYWVGDQRDARTYNMWQGSASARRTWRTGEAERLAAYPTQYEYAAVIDFNRPATATVKWDGTRGQWYTTTPASTRRGSAIFLHVNGAGSTAGCVSLRRADLLAVLTWLDPAQRPRIVMAPEAQIGTA